MNDWISKSLIVLFLAALLMPAARQLLDGQACCTRTAGDCGGGGCGNLRGLQAMLDRNTLRFGRLPDHPHKEPPGHGGSEIAGCNDYEVPARHDKPTSHYASEIPVSGHGSIGGFSTEK